jgi:hypothetical protein
MWALVGVLGLLSLFYSAARWAKKRGLLSEHTEEPIG